MGNGTIYMLTNEVTGMRYVGRTTRPLEERLAGHWDAAFNLRKKTKLSFALRKHGPESFQVRELKRDVPRRRLAAEEDRYIDKYRTRFPHGYNMVGGSSNAIARPRRSYSVERSVTVKESVTFYENGKPVLKRTRVYRETRRSGRARLPK